MNKKMDIPEGSYEVNIEDCAYKSRYSYPCVCWQLRITAGPLAGLVIQKYNNLTSKIAFQQWQRELAAFSVHATSQEKLKKAAERIVGQACQVRVTFNKQGYLQTEIDFEATRKLRVDRFLEELFAKHGAPDNPAPPAGEDTSAPSPPTLFS